MCNKLFPLLYFQWFNRSECTSRCWTRSANRLTGLWHGKERWEIAFSAHVSHPTPTEHFWSHCGSASLWLRIHWTAFVCAFLDKICWEEKGNFFKSLFSFKRRYALNLHVNVLYCRNVVAMVYLCAPCLGLRHGFRLGLGGVRRV